MAAIRTVADLVAELQKQPQDLPVLVGCHFDNDNGLTDRVGVALEDVEHSEGEFYMSADPSWSNTFKAVTVS